MWQTACPRVWPCPLTDGHARRDRAAPRCKPATSGRKMRSVRALEPDPQCHRPGASNTARRAASRSGARAAASNISSRASCLLPLPSPDLLSGSGAGVRSPGRIGVAGTMNRYRLDVLSHLQPARTRRSVHWIRSSSLACARARWTVLVQQFARSARVSCEGQATTPVPRKVCRVSSTSRADRVRLPARKSCRDSGGPGCGHGLGVPRSGRGAPGAGRGTRFPAPEKGVAKSEGVRGC